MRVYHNTSARDVSNLKLIAGLFSGLGHVDLCNATKVVEDRQLNNIFAMTWHFIPLLDEMVDVLMSRDGDSPIFQGEVDAVNECVCYDVAFFL